MELVHLREIVVGLDSLAKIEKEHPALGAKLLSFIENIRSCCRKAYGRLSKYLGEVRALPPNPNDEELERVIASLADAPDSAWFRDVTGICAQLAALAETFDGPLRDQVTYTSPHGGNWKDFSVGKFPERFEAHSHIASLFSLLERQERELKDDLRHAVHTLQAMIGQAKGTGDIAPARAYAITVDSEIAHGLASIESLCYQLKGSSSVAHVLTREEIADQAMRRPERVLILNMFFAVLAFALGAAAFQVINFYQFLLVSAFTFTIVTVVNAFYLRTIDKLSEEGFLALMQLAILKFFAPLFRRRGHVTDQSAN